MAIVKTRLAIIYFGTSQIVELSNLKSTSHLLIWHCCCEGFQKIENPWTIVALSWTPGQKLKKGEIPGLSRDPWTLGNYEYVL